MAAYPPGMIITVCFEMLVAHLQGVDISDFERDVTELWFSRWCGQQRMMVNKLFTPIYPVE